MTGKPPAENEPQGKGENDVCNCISKVNEMLSDHNARLLVPIFGPQRPFLATDKVDSKKRGKPPAMFPTFCPFCGEKYEDEDQLIR
jgi:hypothetical protein